RLEVGAPGMAAVARAGPAVVPPRGRAGSRPPQVVRRRGARRRGGGRDGGGAQQEGSGTGGGAGGAGEAVGVSSVLGAQCSVLGASARCWCWCWCWCSCWELAEKRLNSRVMSKTRMIEAVKQLDIDTVRTLLAADPDLLRVTDRRGFNLLHIACCVPCADLGIAESHAARMVNLLLDEGLDVESKLPPEQDGCTALFFAV